MMSKHPTPEQVNTGHYTECQIVEAERDLEGHPELYGGYDT